MLSQRLLCNVPYINGLEKISLGTIFLAGNFDDRIIIIPELIFSWMVGGVISSLVSPKFPHVPLGIGGWPLGYKE